MQIEKQAAWLLVLAALVGCAASKPLPPGDELEMPPAAAQPAPGSPLDPVTPASPDERALESAFDPSAAPAAAGGPGSPDAAIASAAPDPAASQPGNAASPLDDETQARNDFAAAVKPARLALARRQLDALKEALPELERLSALAGPSEQQQAHELAFRAAMLEKNSRTARRSAERWLLACGPQAVDTCRARALTSLASIPNSDSQRVRFVRNADDCLRRAEQTRSAPGCLESALQSYQRLGDRLMIARVHHARASAASSDARRTDEARDLYSRAEKSCSDARCLTVRRKALRGLGQLLLRDGDAAGSARAFLAEERLGTSTLPPERRTYSRTDLVERACAALDSKDGPGTCRKLEKSLYSAYSFRDFSVRKTRQLAEQDVLRVYTHFGVMLQDCLAARAETLVPPVTETVEVRWMVRNDGRVDQVKLGRNEHEATSLASCLRKQFTVWRYPRYDGEAQHVEQSFTLSARRR